jgi:hypothetical protein
MPSRPVDGIHNRGVPEVERMRVGILTHQLRLMVVKLAEDYGLSGPQARDVAKQILARMLDELKVKKYLGED